MKTIANPKISALYFILVPIPLVAAGQLIFHLNISTRLWMGIALTCIALFLATITYFCIKQKCYKQLATQYIIWLSFAVITYLQFVYIPSLSQP